MESALIVKKNNLDSINETNRDQMNNYATDDAKDQMLLRLGTEKDQVENKANVTINHKNNNGGNDVNFKNNDNGKDIILFEKVQPAILNVNEIPLEFSSLEPFNVELTRKNSNTIQKDLLEMGFELSLINNLFANLEVNTTEQAIEYVSKIEGKWNHPVVFVDLIKTNDEVNNDNEFVIGKDKRCAICGDIEENHYFNYQEKLRSLKNEQIDILILEKKRSSELNINSNNKSFDQFLSKINNDKIMSETIDPKKTRINRKLLDRFGADIDREGNIVNHSSDPQFKNDHDLENNKNLNLSNIEFPHRGLDKIANLNPIARSMGDIGDGDDAAVNFVEQVAKAPNSLSVPESQIIRPLASDAVPDDLFNAVASVDKLNDIKPKQDKPKECEICMGEISQEYSLECKHSFCKECLAEYINNKINSSEIRSIPCPRGIDKCAFRFDEKIIKNLVSGENMNRYYKFLRRNEITNQKELVFCPIPDCDSFAITESSKITKGYLETLKAMYVYDYKKSENLHFSEDKLTALKENLHKNIGTCIENNHSFCFKCRHPSHPEKQCELGLQNEFNKFVSDDNHFVKKCPKCKFFIQKNEGCNHITCANKECKYEFCWICMGKYKSGHYRNIFSPCYNMQNSRQGSFIVKHPWLIYPRYLGIFILLVVLFCIALVFSPLIIGFLLAYQINKSNRFERSFRNRCFRKLGTYTQAITYTVFGLGLFPIVFYFIAILPLVLIYLVCKKCCD